METRSYERHSTRRILLAAALVIFGIPGALLATVDVITTEAGVSSTPPPDQALVYFAHCGLGGQRDIVVDKTPVARLKKKSYVAAVVEPGARLFWSPDSDPGFCRAAWVDLRPGASYLVWIPDFILDNPEKVRGLVEQGEYQYTPPVAEDREELALLVKWPSKHGNSLTLAGDPSTTELPSRFERVAFREDLPRRRGQWPGSAPKGSVAVDVNNLTFHSKLKTIVIPVKEIQSVDLGPESFLCSTSGTPGVFLHLRHGRPEAPRDVYLGPLDSSRSNALYSAFTEAMATHGEPSQGVSTSEATGLAETSAEEHYCYDGLRGQFVIDLPRNWRVYDQHRHFTGRAGPYGMVIFSPVELAELASEEMIEELARIDTGSTPSFFLDRQPARRKMSCSGFSPKHQQEILADLEGGLRTDRDATAPEPLTLEEVSLGGCQGLLVEGRRRQADDTEWRMKTYVLSDGRVLYYFSLRNPTELFDANLPVFERSMSTLKLALAAEASCDH